jgi:hypothetical protein
MVSKKKVIIVAIVIIAVVVVAVGVYLWQSLSASFAEVEDTIKSFLVALNDYDADASWALMSPTLQSSYGTKEDFKSDFLDGLEQSSWHAELTSVSSKSIETRDGTTTACFVVTLQITEADVGTYGETYTFKLVKIVDQWKIDEMRVGVWD